MSLKRKKHVWFDFFTSLCHILRPSTTVTLDHFVHPLHLFAASGLREKQVTFRKIRKASTAQSKRQTVKSKEIEETEAK